MRRVGILSRLRSRFSQMSPYTEEETRKLSVELRDTAPTLIILASGLGLSLEQKDLTALENNQHPTSVFEKKVEETGDAGDRREMDGDQMDIMDPDERFNASRGKWFLKRDKVLGVAFWEKLISDMIHKEIAHRLMRSNVLVAAVYTSALPITLYCGRNKPLYVIPLGEQFTNGALHKVTTRTQMSEAVWLLFHNLDLRLDEFFLGVNIPFDCEFLVAHKSKFHDNVVLTEVYRINSTLPLKTSCFGNWTDGRGISVSSLTLYQRRNNLEGLPLKTGTMQLIPKKASAKKKKKEMTGYVGSVWKTLETQLNFTTVLLNPRGDRTRGVRTENGTWTGVFGLLQRREVDITNGVYTMISMRMEILDYTVPTIDIKMCMVIKRPTSYEMQWDMFQSFSRPLWISVACAMLLLTLVTYIQSWVGNKERSILTALFLVIGAYCQKGYSDNPYTIPARVTRLTLYVTTFAVFSFYSAAFTSDLTLQEPAMPFHSFEEFLEDGSYMLGMMPESAHIEYFRDSTEKLYKDIYSRKIAPHEKTLDNSDIVGMQRLCDEMNYAHFTSSYNLMKQGYLPNCSVTVLKQACFPGHIAIAIAKGSPYLRLFNYKQREFCRPLPCRLVSHTKTFHISPQEEIKCLDQVGHKTGPPLPIHLSGNVAHMWSLCAKWDGAPSCWHTYVYEHPVGYVPTIRGVRLNTVDDLVLLALSEDDLQRSIYNLQQVAATYNMEISTDKTKIMAFCGKYPIQSKICLDNKILERCNSFPYLGYNISIFEELDISQKINKYTRAMGIINSVMKPSLVQKNTRIHLYNTLARPMLSYGSEAWTLRKADKSRITACEMRFVRRTAGYTKWDLKRNCEILKELKSQPVLDYIVQYQSNWKHHLERMSNNKLPKAIYEYVPHGQRSVGRLLRDGVKILCETVTGLVA
ncbi:hypothetical protein ANN_16133 [Periplaneta americana]|uniref:Ionotropic glutamate receptor L-glutamate and glycine-binding domain-containing protein n=1 Tax=Periplaneta americana TaxID=6978 RepID=A0ABQ8SJE2_PERAM|nr:hypothetical protein ANN_16133 [Periplaneta americana]